MPGADVATISHSKSDSRLRGAYAKFGIRPWPTPIVKGPSFAGTEGTWAFSVARVFATYVNRTSKAPGTWSLGAARARAADPADAPATAARSVILHARTQIPDP